MYRNGLFLFRRDLRIDDNVGLNLLSNVCENIYTIFIYTPEQISNKNKYKSEKAITFMNQSINDLKNKIIKKGGNLYTLYGSINNIIRYIIPLLDISVIGFNIDYTPYSIRRDDEIISLCKQMNVQYILGYDYYLINPTKYKLKYKKFTPFYNLVKKYIIDIPTYYNIRFKKSTKIKKYNIEWNTNEPLILIGGRTNGLKQLEYFITKKYITNDLNIYTSLLSPYIKFGCISIREVYLFTKHNSIFTRQLFWREFYALIMLNNPYVLYRPMKDSYNYIIWNNNSEWFDAWCNGHTGFPIIDASMRELKSNGYIHNRSRLIVSNFLIKILFISWQRGEKYFAQTLIDYDPSNNNGNWQWSAGCGVDNQPYFRIFNPWIQSKRFDNKCHYIKKWIPELQHVLCDDIHKWYLYYHKYNTYIPPICDYYEQKTKFIQYMKHHYSNFKDL